MSKFNEHELVGNISVKMHMAKQSTDTVERGGVRRGAGKAPPLYSDWCLLPKIYAEFHPSFDGINNQSPASDLKLPV
jgi:hypothetical protein